jgi:hypothetical protein
MTPPDTAAFAQQPHRGLTPCNCPSPDILSCGHCNRRWCGHCNPTPAARCPYEDIHDPDPFDELPADHQRRAHAADVLIDTSTQNATAPASSVNAVLHDLLAPVTGSSGARARERTTRLIYAAHIGGVANAIRRLAPEWAEEDTRLHVELTLAQRGTATLTEHPDGGYELRITEVWVDSEDPGYDGVIDVPLTRDHVTHLRDKLTAYLDTTDTKED